jgi:hypothetical protein
MYFLGAVFIEGVYAGELAGGLSQTSDRFFFLFLAGFNSVLIFFFKLPILYLLWLRLK